MRSLCMVAMCLSVLACESTAPSPTSPTPISPTPGVRLQVNPSAFLASGSTVTIRANSVGRDGVGLARIPLTITADGGELSTTQVTTDTAGWAEVTLASAQPVTVSVQAANGSDARVTVPAVPPYQINLRPSTTAGNVVTLPTHVPASTDPLGYWYGVVSIETVGGAANHRVITPATVRLNCGGTGALGDLEMAGFTGVRSVRCGYRGASLPYEWSDPGYQITVEAIAANGWSSHAAVNVRVQ